MSRKKGQKQMLIVDVSSVKVRNTWGGVKPYTRVQQPKTVYRRKGRRVESLD